jgi:enoyl-CoA hydratase/carnithine racemase
MTTTAATTATMRTPTLATLGLGSVLEIFKRGRLPASATDLVDQVFGRAGRRGALVVSGANGIVGAGKTMQFGARLTPFGVPIVALDFPGAPDGIGRQYPGLVRAFGKDGADAIMANVVRLTYDGKRLPAELQRLRPRFLLEAIPEILELKRAHYNLFRAMFPDIEIRSVTSGFPSTELGVGIAHPAFPHEINRVFEVVEPTPSAVTQLLWALGLVPMAVSDDWSFVLDVLFCGITLAAIRYHHHRNMPYWKVDKYVRRLVGPNPFRAHDAIGAKGANFLTWSCLHHLGKAYGGLFTPAAELVERKDTGQDWYPPDHFRPLVDWSLDAEAEADFETWILGPLFQMAALTVHERRSHLAQINLIGELCAQFRQGILAVMRRRGPDGVRRTVEAYHRLYPAAAETAWHPEALEQIESTEWRQLYVNAEHDGTMGAITLGREAYNRDVDEELNRAIDWLMAAGIERVVVSHDFHLATQLVGADTAEFYPALEREEAGFQVSHDWSRTARRLHDAFAVSVGFIGGKRCLGGMLELMLHCHFVVAVEDTALGFPEVTLPVVPGMEGCHWPFRKAPSEHWPRILELLLGGRPVAARDAVGWLVDAAGPLEHAAATAGRLVAGMERGIARRDVVERPLSALPSTPAGLPSASGGREQGRQAIRACVDAACGATLADALAVQSKHSAGFMRSDACRRGRVGVEFGKTMRV